MNATAAIPRRISCDEALRVAQADAERAYGDVTEYRITVTHHPDGWHIDYDLVQPLVAGGGPHYVVDEHTGKIVTKRYEQ